MCHQPVPTEPRWISPSLDSMMRSLGHSGATTWMAQPSPVVVWSPPPKSPAMRILLPPSGPTPGHDRSGPEGMQSFGSESQTDSSGGDSGLVDSIRAASPSIFSRPVVACRRGLQSQPTADFYTEVGWWHYKERA